MASKKTGLWIVQRKSLFGLTIEQQKLHMLGKMSDEIA